MYLFSIRSLTKIFSIARANEDATSRPRVASSRPVLPSRSGPGQSNNANSQHRNTSGRNRTESDVSAFRSDLSRRRPHIDFLAAICCFLVPSSVTSPSVRTLLCHT